MVKEIYINIHLIFILPTITFGQTHSLLQLFVFLRHGDRTPIHRIEDLETYAPASWASEFGQLTEIGIVQHFNLGLWMRKNYKDFIPNVYTQESFHISSSDVDRTLMSASAFSAGLFYNSTDFLNPYLLKWGPVPIHTTGKMYDSLFSQRSCPRRDVLFHKMLNSISASLFLDKYQYLLETINKNTHLNLKYFDYFPRFAEYLHCLRAHNRELPIWLTSKVQEDIETVWKYIWQLRFVEQQQLGLSIGVLLDHVFKLLFRTREIVNSNSETSKSYPSIFAFSGHDTNLSPLLTALTGSMAVIPAYATAVVLEMHRGPTESTNYLLRLREKFGPSDEQGKFIQFHACKEISAELGCPLATVENYIQDLRLEPSDYDSLCDTGFLNTGLRLVFSSFFTFFLLIILVSATVVLLSIIKRRKFAGPSILPTRFSLNDKHLH